MVCLVSSGKRLKTMPYMSYIYVGEPLAYPACYLRMIVSYSLRLQLSTGQLVSMGKCSILFGDQCIEAVQVELQGILKYETQCFEEKYLGLPVPKGRLKSGNFKSLKEKFSKHASNWPVGQNGLDKGPWQNGFQRHKGF
jgi:hypothetical protein